MEKKIAPHFVKSIEDRTVTGLFAIHGNIDEYGDRSWPGSFANVKVNGRDRARFLWAHRADEPPIASIQGVREIGRDELPESVLSYAPNATGAVEVTRSYLDTARGNEVLAGLKAGAIEEMSYAYETKKVDFEEVDGDQIRNIREVKLYDISDVNHGANPATVAIKSRLLDAMPLIDHSQTVLAAIEELHERYAGLKALRTKEGRTFSSANMTRLTGIKDSLAELLTNLDELLKAGTPEKAIGVADMAQLRAASRTLRMRAIELGVRV